MKTILSFLLTATMLSTSVTAAPVPQEMATPVEQTSITTSDIFKRFNVHRQQNGVAIQWTVSNIDQISSFIIERSWDGVYFDTIDVLDATSDQNRYLDNNEIYPGFWYYRITAVMNDGTEVTSEVDMVRIVRNG
jgi:hypothetical protein